MTMLSCAKKVTIILSNLRTPFKHWKKNIRSINPQSFSTLLVTFYSKTKQNKKHKSRKKNCNWKESLPWESNHIYFTTYFQSNLKRSTSTLQYRRIAMITQTQRRLIFQMTLERFYRKLSSHCDSQAQGLA